MVALILEIYLISITNFKESHNQRIPPLFELEAVLISINICCIPLKLTLVFVKNNQQSQVYLFLCCYSPGIYSDWKIILKAQRDDTPFLSLFISSFAYCVCVCVYLPVCVCLCMCVALGWAVSLLFAGITNGHSLFSVLLTQRLNHIRVHTNAHTHNERSTTRFSSTHHRSMQESDVETATAL